MPKRALATIFKKKNKTAKTDSPNPNHGRAAGRRFIPPIGTAQSPSLKAYDNYDFVPGEKIFFAEDFSDDLKGEFPAHWQLCYGQGVVTDFDGKKVFALTEAEHGDNAVVMEPRMKKKSGYMPANFTVELDIYVPRAPMQTMISGVTG